ncbi:YjbH domain-containing protein [Thiomicrorhabdus sp.]|uniref:YjbH domain-containing protein n=1 Tax=Thiomicrorhabdus sp. TaxID=2039724 RepID=UPI0029C6EBC9|nr:YjbH domain-containing protein [Thiomicrorhabdus sp.]
MIVLKNRFSRVRSQAIFFPCLIAGLAAAPFSSQAEEGVFGIGAGFKGAGGLFVVPTAEVMPYGRLGFSLNNFLLSGYPADAEGQNYYVSAGVWKGLEVQIGLNEIHPKGADPNQYGDFYKRDLVGNFKYSHDLSVIDSRLKIAIGGQDIAGTVVYSQLFYGVATLVDDFGSLSLGYASDSESTVSHRGKENLRDVFGGVSLNLPYGLTAIAEYDGSNKRAGLGYQSLDFFGTGIGVNVRASLVNDRKGEDTVISAGISVPLMHSGKASARFRRPEASRPATDAFLTEKQTVSRVSDEVERASEAAKLAKTALDAEETGSLVTELERAGLQYVTVGMFEDTLYIRYQNRLFDWSEIDALAQVMALASSYAKARNIPNLLIDVLSERNPVLRVSVGTEWGFGAGRKMERKGGIPRFFSPRFEAINAFSDFPVPVQDGGARTEFFSVKISPQLVNTIGTEVGAYDYSLGIATEISTELWKGARMSLNRVDLLQNSYNFKTGGRFDDYAIDSGFQELVLQQTLVPFDGFVNTASLHQSLSDGDARSLIDEWRYYAFEGRHQLYGYAAYNWHGKQSGERESYYGFGGYELFWPEQALSFHLEYGKYRDQDRTAKFGIKSYVGDSIIRASLMREREGYEKVYVGLMVPLTPAKALAAGGVTLRGENKWRYGIQTMTDYPSQASGNINIGDPRYQAFGFYASQPYEPHDDVMDSGRLTPVYLRSKTAYLKQLVGDLLSPSAAD